MSTNRISLVQPTPALFPKETGDATPKPLTVSEPSAVLGAPREGIFITEGVKPNRTSCFGPRGAACLSDGTLVIADTGHHRLLGWQHRPEHDGAEANWVFGQKDFDLEGRNAKGEVSRLSLNVPTGVCAAGSGLAVADAWNNRVLVWDSTPQSSNTPPDRVFGQPSFDSDTPNCGLINETNAHSMHWPYGVHVHDKKLFVADSENRRVLIFDDYQNNSACNASLVLGQPDFSCRNENAGTGPDARSMRWPHGITVWHGNLCVADAGNNRIMVWDGIPSDHYQPCTWVLGQAHFDKVDHNQSLYWPRASTTNMPYDLTSVGQWLVVADTANSRLLGWHIDDLATGAPAQALAGQNTFADKGDNRWQTPVADSFCWPYGIAFDDDRLIVADSGNNRVSVWKTVLS